MILMLIRFEKGKTTSKTTQQMINSENKIFKRGNTVKTVKFTKEIVHKDLFVLGYADCNAVDHSCACTVVPLTTTVTESDI